jgi:hypothetical protein
MAGRGVTDFRPSGWLGGNPEIRMGGMVTDHPHAVVRRRRNPLWLVLGLLLLAGAAVGLALSIFGLVEDASYAEEDVVAEGTVGALDQGPAEVATFTAGGAEPFTVWIDTDGIWESNRRENVVAATSCVASLADGDEATFRGSRQGNAITIEDDSTVGWFTAAEGGVEVACQQVPFGRRRTQSWLDDEHPFVVVAGKPASPIAGFAVLSASIVAILLGIGALTRWARGRLVAT